MCGVRGQGCRSLFHLGALSSQHVDRRFRSVRRYGFGGASNDPAFGHGGGRDELPKNQESASFGGKLRGGETVLTCQEGAGKDKPAVGIRLAAFPLNEVFL